MESSETTKLIYKIADVQYFAGNNENLLENFPDFPISIPLANI